METKYETLKRALRKASKSWDEHPLSNSAKNEYYIARQAMVDYYKELTNMSSVYSYADSDGSASVEIQT